MEISAYKLLRFIEVKGVSVGGYQCRLSCAFLQGKNAQDCFLSTHLGVAIGTVVFGDKDIDFMLIVGERVGRNLCFLLCKSGCCVGSYNFLWGSFMHRKA